MRQEIYFVNVQDPGQQSDVETAKAARQHIRKAVLSTPFKVKESRDRRTETRNKNGSVITVYIRTKRILELSD